MQERERELGHWQEYRVSQASTWEEQHIVSRANIIEKFNAYGNWSRNWSRSRNTTTVSHRHQLKKSSILLLEIKRKVMILYLESTILLFKTVKRLIEKLKLTGSGMGTGALK